MFPNLRLFSPLNQRYVEFYVVVPYTVSERRLLMDQAKIGKFIARCRKQAGLTQMQLAEKSINRRMNTKETPPAVWQGAFGYIFASNSDFSVTKANDRAVFLLSPAARNCNIPFSRITSRPSGVQLPGSNPNTYSCSPIIFH